MPTVRVACERARRCSAQWLMAQRCDAEIEALLMRERRAGLPLSRQLVVYLDPFALFKDASKGALAQQERARSYNRAIRWMLLAYIRRWSCIALTSLLAILPAEALSAQAAFFIVPAAAFAFSACLAITIALCAFVAYILLGASFRR